MARVTRHPARHGLHPQHAAARRSGWSTAALAWTVTLVLLLWGSGVVLHAWPAEALMQLGPAQMALRRAAVVAHGTGVWALCLFAGRWAWPHALLVWQRRPDVTWTLGMLMATMLAVIAATGLFLLYGPANGHEGASALHWWMAVGLPLLLAAHAWRRWARRPTMRG